MEYVERGDLQQALASMISDLGKHEETQGHPGIELSRMGLFGGHYSDRHNVTKWIQGFN